MLRLNTKKHGHIVEYEISGTKEDVRKAIMDIYDLYPIEKYFTCVHEHLVMSDAEATAFITRDYLNGEPDETLTTFGGDKLGPSKGVFNSCILFALIGAAITIITILVRIL